MADKSDEILKALKRIEEKVDRGFDRIEDAVVHLASKVVAPPEVAEVKRRIQRERVS